MNAALLIRPKCYCWIYLRHINTYKHLSLSHTAYIDPEFKHTKLTTHKALISGLVTHWRPCSLCVTCTRSPFNSVLSQFQCGTMWNQIPFQFQNELKPAVWRGRVPFWLQTHFIPVNQSLCSLWRPCKVIKLNYVTMKWCKICSLKSSTETQTCSKKCHSLLLWKCKLLLKFKVPAVHLAASQKSAATLMYLLQCMSCKSNSSDNSIYVLTL